MLVALILVVALLGAVVVLVRARAREREIEEGRALLERLGAVQRSISHRAPLSEIFDAVTGGAAVLLGDEVVGLRLVVDDDPEWLELVAVVGVAPEDMPALRRTARGIGVGGRAVTEQRLVVEHDYGHSHRPLGPFVTHGLAAAMAAPVRRDGVVVGSLVVATYRRGRRYSDAEQRALLSFAEHASIALNDASAVEALRRAATHDDLTGLPNRALLLDRVEQALARSARSGATVCAIFLDLDRFKAVNDAFGHDDGDQLLRAVATRLLEVVRPEDTVARLGGDEFVVLVEGLDVDDVLGLGERLRAAVSQPIASGTGRWVMTASIGIALGAGCSSAEELIGDADIAMYRAKRTGGDRVEVYDEALRAAAVRRLEVEQGLRAALDGSQLRLLFQPVVDLRSGRVVGAEALVRWLHRERGMLAPAEFLGVAEDTGLIVPLGEWVLEEAVAAVAGWVRGGYDLDGFRVRCNLSPVHVQQPDLPDRLSALLSRSGVSARHIGVEVTESALEGDTVVAAEVLARLRQLGVQVAIDDFGVGYSSLARLLRLSVDSLKIDRGFVAGLSAAGDAGRADGGRVEEAVVSSVVHLGSALGLDVVAEGVEHADQRALLVSMGCRLGQGYLFGAGVTAEAFAALHLPVAGDVLAAAVVGSTTRSSAVVGQPM